MRSLYDISDDLLAIDQLLEASGGDVTDPKVEEEISRWFETLETERDAKLDNYAALIRDYEARAEVRRAEAKRLAEKAKQDQNQADYLKQRLMHFFIQHGLKKIETRRYVLSRRTSGGKRRVLLLVDPEALPEEFQRISIGADLEAIRELLEAGAVLEFAELDERKEYFSIR